MTLRKRLRLSAIASAEATSTIQKAPPSDTRAALLVAAAMSPVAAAPAAAKSASSSNTAPASVIDSPTPRDRHSAPATSRPKPATIAAAHAGASAFHRAIAFGVRMRFGEKPTKPRPRTPASATATRKKVTLLKATFSLASSAFAPLAGRAARPFSVAAI